MANLYDAFLGLLPSQPVLVGEVTAVSEERHTITLIGGGQLDCVSQKPYEVGTKVFVQDKIILSQAPDNTLVSFQV